MKYQVLLLCMLCITGTFAVYGNKGACKTGKYTDVNVDWQNYLGKWYNVRVSSSFMFQEASDQCTVANYSLNEDGSIKVDNRAVKADGKISQAIGTAEIYAAGHLKVSFSKLVPIQGNYEIVYMSPDQNTVSVVGCNGFFLFGTSNVWILTRDYNTPASEIQAAVDATEKLGFDVSDLIANGVSQCSRL